MKLIDTSKWKKFRVGDLFEIVSGKGITKKEITEHRGSLPAIQSGEEKFGLIGFIDEEYCIRRKYAISKGECLTVARSGSSGYVGYQAKKCVVGDSAKILEPKFEANTSRLLFVRALLMENKKKYAYKDKVTTENYEKDIILLPATSSGDPDWVYIENYMRKYEQQTTASITALKHLTETHKPKRIDTSKWREFTLKELGFNNFHGKRLTKAERKDGSIPFITAGKENQGIIGTIGNNRTTYNNAITVDMFGNVFYHHGELAGDDNIYFFVNDTLSAYVKQFIVVSLQSVIKSSFEYRDQFRQDNADSAKVYLPVTPNGEPDWNLMEQYMRQVELQVKNSILALTTPTPQVQQQTNLVNYGTVNIYEK